MSHIQNAIRTEAPVTPEVINRLIESARLIHGILGKLTEVGEFADELKRHIFYGKELDKVNLLEEIGDGHWYDALILNFLGHDDFLVALDRVLAKLRKRFPDKFTEHNALNRDLEAERKELEQLDEHLKPTLTRLELDRARLGLDRVADVPELPIEKEHFTTPNSQKDISESYYLLDLHANPVSPGRYVVLNLDDPDPKVAHAAWLAATLFKKEIWHDEKHRRYADRIEQTLIAVREEQPPLKG